MHKTEVTLDQNKTKSKHLVEGVMINSVQH